MYTLESFKKANKQRRQKMAQNAGFDNVDDYAAFLAGKKKALKKDANVGKKPIKKVDGKPVRMVIAFDSTGSMSAYIQAVKKHVKELIPKLFANTPNLKLKVVVFGDYCDMTSTSTFTLGKAYQESEMTDNQNELIGFINSAQDTGGGDIDEFYELVIKKVIDETSWSDGINTILLIGDCAPHPVGYTYKNITNQIDWRDEAQRAKKLGIKFDTLTIGYQSQHNAWYKELSKITSGVCTPFSNSQKTGNLMEAATYFAGASAGSKKGIESFTMAAEVAYRSGDSELIGLYKSYSDKL